MDRMKKAVLAALRQAGYQAEAGLAWRRGSPLEREKICVCIQRVQTIENAVSCYQGTDDQGQERFAVELELELSLKLLTPREVGGEGCEQFGQMVFGQLLTGVDGFPVESVAMGESSYDSVRDCFTAEIRTVSRVVTYVARTDSSTLIEDIEIKGTILK